MNQWMIDSNVVIVVKSRNNWKRGARKETHTHTMLENTLSQQQNKKEGRQAAFECFHNGWDGVRPADPVWLHLDPLWNAEGRYRIPDKDASAVQLNPWLLHVPKRRDSSFMLMFFNQSGWGGLHFASPFILTSPSLGNKVKRGEVKFCFQSSLTLTWYIVFVATLIL